MKKPELNASKRALMGKKARFLRRQGIVPANVCGHGVDSLPVECSEADLAGIIKGGTSRIIALDVKGENSLRTVLIKNVSYHPISQSLIHVDFYQVNMTEKMAADIPLLIKGHAPALSSKENFLDHQLNEITVECLPDKLPQHIDVDVSILKEAGDTIYVSDLDPADGVVFLTPGDHIIVRIAHAAKAEAEAEEVTEAETEPVEAGEPETETKTAE